MAQGDGVGRPNMADLLSSARNRHQPPLIPPAMFTNTGGVHRPPMSFPGQMMPPAQMPAPPLVNMAYLQNRRDLPQTYGMPVENGGNFPANGVLSPVNVLSPPHNGLFGVDISQSNFNRAINFEVLQNGLLPNGGIPGPFNGAGDASIEEQELDEEEEDTLSSVAEQNPLEQSLDMLEHHGAQEQARYIAQFKQLRDWQSNQQQMLLQQQQQQLDVFRKERERVHQLIAKQRHTQWGAPQQPKNDGAATSAEATPTQTQTETGLSQTLPPAALANMTSPKKSTMRPGSTIPAALANGTMALAQMNHMLKSATTNHVTMIDGRPAPVLPDRPDTPEELRENGNPDLDSTLDTISTGVTEDVLGITGMASDFRLPPEFSRQGPQGGINGARDDVPVSVGSMQSATAQQLEQLLQLQQLLSQQQNASLMQNAHQMPPRMTAVLPSQTHHTNNHVMNMYPSQPSEHSHPPPPHLNGAYHNLSNHPTHHPAISSATHPSVSTTGHPPLKSSAPAWSDNLLQNTWAAGRTHGHSHDVLDFRESSHPSIENGGDIDYDDDDVESDQNSLSDVEEEEEAGVNDKLVEQRMRAREDEEGYEYGDAERDASDDEASDEDAEAGNGFHGDEDEMRDPQSVDDIPVAAVAGQAKTFEELLEEELRKEAGKKEQESIQNSNTKPRKHTFLKRGEGIARFNAAPPRGKKPSTAKKKPPAKPPPLPTKPPPLPASAPPKKVSPPSGSQTRPQSKATAILKKAKAASEVTKTSAKPAAQPSKQAGAFRLNKPVLTKKPPSAPVKPETAAAKLEAFATRTKPESVSASTRTAAPSTGAAINQLQVPSSGNNASGGSVTSVTDSVGEISFQTHMKKRAENEVKERGELDEFEILEQFADDNESFMSNLSAVERVLRDVDTPTEIPGQLNQIKSFLPKKPLPTTQESDTEEDAADLSDNDDDDTPLTSDHDGEVASKQAPTDVRLKNGPERPKMQRKVAPHSPSSHVDHPVFSPTQTPLAQLSRVLQFSDSESDNDEHRHQNQSVKAKNELNNHIENQGVFENHLSSQQPVSSSQLRLIKAVPVYTSTTLDQQAKSLNKRKDEHAEKTNVWSKYTAKSLSSSEEESEEEDGEEGNRTLKNEDEFVFDDDDKWDDSMREDSDDFPLGAKPSSITQKKPAIFKTKVIAGEDQSCASQPEKAATPPPTSQLVTKLFPNLKQEQQIQQQKLAQEKLQATQQLDPADGAQAQALREKLTELENEIEKFRSENNNLGRLRKEREECLAKLQKEIAEFEKQKNDELKRIHEYKSEEMKKLKRERKLFDQYQKATRNQPDKKDRQEIEALKAQVAELQEEMRKKDSRWTSSTHRLRDRIEQLEQENTELKEEIKFLEKQRLAQWQQNETTAPLKGKQVLPKREAVAKKPAFTQQHLKSPKPEAQPKMTTVDNALHLSSDMLDTGDDANTSQMSEAPSQMSVYEDDTVPEPHQLTERSLRPSERPPQLTSSPRKGSDPADDAGGRQSLSRKVAVVPTSISKSVDKGNGEYEEMQHSDGKVEKIYTNGAREILFANGTRKQISKDGQSIIVSFFNGDIKQILPDQRVVYFYADAHTTHTTYPDGLEILQFPNQQTEKHYPDGTKEITFPDHTIKYLFPSGTEESIYPDGTVIRLEKNGERVMEFPNGQREIHTGQYKRREYPDGTVKTVYPDGRQETRYSSGRIRVKDKEGSIIVDKRV